MTSDLLYLQYLWGPPGHSYYDLLLYYMKRKMTNLNDELKPSPRGTLIT